MGGKILRSAILLGITGFAIRIGRWMYTVFMELFHLQLQAYEWILQSKDTLAAGQEHIEGVWNNALELLGKEQHATDIPREDTIMQRLQIQANKLQKIAWGIGGGIGIIVWKILFDIAFGIKKSIQDIKEFIH